MVLRECVCWFYFKLDKYAAAKGNKFFKFGVCDTKNCGHFPCARAYKENEVVAGVLKSLD